MADNRNPNALERNAERAECAQQAVVAYAAVKENNNTDVYDFVSEDAQDRLCDLLADLRHWANQQGLDFDEANRIAAAHFGCETDEEYEDEEPVREGGAA